MKAIRALLIDDHNVMRQAVASMIDGEDDIRVVGQCGDAESGIAAAAELKPDVVIIDLKMPGTSGLTAIGRIAAQTPRSGIIVFTQYDNPAYVWETMNAGATGYVLKSASRDDLLRAIRAVHAGDGYLQAEVTRPLLKRLAHDARAAEERATLTIREMQILECLADGLSNKSVAAKLNITEDTVKSHLRHLYEKLGAMDRAHAVAIALRQNLIE